MKALVVTLTVEELHSIVTNAVRTAIAETSAEQALDGASNRPMRVAAYARHVGQSRSTVYRKIERGLPREPDGRIVPSKAREWERSMRAARLSMLDTR